jgi:uncharacterized protein YjbJ (UPF0337 family)
MYGGAHCALNGHELSDAAAFAGLHRELTNAADPAAISITAYRHARHVSTSLVCVVGFWIFYIGVPASTGCHYQEHVMSTNKDQVEGRVKEAKGKIKEVAGIALDDEKMEAKGKVQAVIGKAQAKFGDIRQEIKDSPKKGT